MQRETFKKKKKKKAERIPLWSKFLSFFLISLKVFTKQSYCNSSKQEKTARGCDSISEVNGEASLVIMEYLKRLYPCKSQKTKFRFYTKLKLSLISLESANRFERNFSADLYSCWFLVSPLSSRLWNSCLEFFNSSLCGFCIFVLFLLWIVYLLLYWERYRSRAKWVHLRFLGRALPNALFNKTWWFTASIKGFDAKERIMS